MAGSALKVAGVLRGGLVRPAWAGRAPLQSGKSGGIEAETARQGEIGGAQFEARFAFGDEFELQAQRAGRVRRGAGGDGESRFEGGGASGAEERPAGENGKGHEKAEQASAPPHFGSDARGSH